jgi:hypothetical protein
LNKSQIISRQYQGKTYFDIKAPEGTRGGFVNLKPIQDAIAGLLERIEVLESAVYKEEAPNEANFDDIPVIEPEEEGINPKDIPF